MNYFKSSFIFTGFALALSACVGFFYGGLAMSLSYVVSALILGVLETSVSVDNAVVNAAKLKTMDELWKKRFLTWGMAIAVFGMRLLFPLMIVSIAGHMSPLKAIEIALTKPKEYEAIITSVHMQIMAFGGTFLFLVFSRHFINEEKESHWIPFIGPILSNIGRHGTASLFLPMICIFVMSFYTQEQLTFLLSAFSGLITYLVVDGLGDILDGDNESESNINATMVVAKAGLGAFIYLEVLDASFSFDGVIAAFAITNNFIIIMLGLGIGAMFVRSLTLMMVDKGTLGEFKYLEDGAFWGIGWLVATMFMSVFHIELGEIAVAGVAALLIGLSVFHSVLANKKESS